MTQTQLEAYLQAAHKNLSRKSDPDALADAKRIRAVMRSEPVTHDEIPFVAFAVARVLLPYGGTAANIASCLTGVAGGRSDLLEIAGEALANATGCGPIGLPRRAMGVRRESRDTTPPGEFRIEKSGKREGLPVVDSQHNLDAALSKLGVTTRYDEFSRLCWISRTAVPPQGNGAGRPARDEIRIDDHIIEIMADVESAYDMPCSKAYVRDYLDDLARNRNKFHSVRNYLDGLPEWDGTPRIDNWLVDAGAGREAIAVWGSPTASTEDRQVADGHLRYIRAVSRIVLVAAARRIYQPGAKFDEILVIESPQGKDKSSALEALVPNPDWFQRSFDLHRVADDKYIIEQTKGRWIVELAELAGLRKTEKPAIKQFLSKGSETAALKYERDATRAERQFIPIGTVNPEDPYIDEDGDRRFWPVRVTQFDVPTIVADRDQIWAEALAAHRAGESIRLAPELWDAARVARNEIRDLSSYEMSLAAALGDVTGAVATPDVWKVCGFVDKVPQVDLNKIGGVMKRLGWERSKDAVRMDKRRAYVYYRGTAEERTRKLVLNQMTVQFEAAAR